MSDIETKPTVVHAEKGKAFSRNTRHPVSDKVIKAEWLPDHFGRNMWGVKFPNDPRIYRPRELGTTANAAGREPYTNKSPKN